MFLYPTLHHTCGLVKRKGRTFQHSPNLRYVKEVLNFDAPYAGTFNAFFFYTANHKLAFVVVVRHFVRL